MVKAINITTVISPPVRGSTPEGSGAIVVV
jgi:hypothetical protein